MDKFQKPSTPECPTPLPEQFRIYFLIFKDIQKFSTRLNRSGSNLEINLPS
jgi:hypothetical protein